MMALLDPRRCILILIILSIESTSALRILGIFPLAVKSHFEPCGHLMRALAERGHQVDVYSHFPYSKKPIANYTDHSLVGTAPSLQNGMSYDMFKRVIEHNDMGTLMEIMGVPTCQLMNLPIFQKLANNPPNDPPYDLVVVEIFVSTCYLAWGRHLNIPMIGLVSTNLYDWVSDPLGNPLNLAVDSSVFSTYSPPMSFLERLGNLASSKYLVTTFNHHARRQDAVVKQAFGKDYPSVTELPRDTALTFINYHYALNGIRAYTPGIVPIGGLHISDGSDQEPLPKDINKFLDESKHGFVYVSFGSMFMIETLPKSILDVFYKTFEKLAPVRVLMKVAKPEKLPAGLPANVITHHWLPQVRVLKHKHAKAFVTHGGLLGTQESIYYGVPMIGFPLFGDQHTNIEAYVKRNLAIKLDWEDITEPIFTNAIEEILKNPLYKKSAEKVGALFRDTPMSPKETAVYWTEYVARHGKDTLRPPLVDMPWWQASLLDVYAFLLSIVLLTLFIVKWTLMKLVSSLDTSKTSSSSKSKKNR